MDIEKIQNYYTARRLQWADQKSALLFFFSEVGELAEAYLAHHKKELVDEETQLLINFSALGMQADEIVSRIPGWVRNNDRIRRENIEFEVADCNMMLSVFMYSLTGRTPDDALAEKMRDKLGETV
jgi:NTP pyrophosphatase (non-canonical NTP hydrolase)